LKQGGLVQPILGDGDGPPYTDGFALTQGYGFAIRQQGMLDLD
jgi:hypothetical protein